MSDHDEDMHDPELRALYRKMPEDMPDSATDDAIRAAARRAVGASPHIVLRRRAPWLATAAAAVFGIGLVVQMHQQTPQLLRETLETKAGLPPAAPATEGRTEDAVVPTPASSSARSTPRTTHENQAASKAATAASSEAVRHSAPARKSDASADAAASAEERYAGNVTPAAAGTQAMRDEIIAAPQDKVLHAAPAAAPEPATQAPVQTAPLAKAKKEAASGMLTADAALSEKKSPGDYRQAMARSDFTRALMLLESDSGEERNVARLVDHDILQLLAQADATPACTTLPSSRLGNSKPLCDMLTLRAAGQAPPSDWRQRLDNTRLWQDDLAYRHAALEKLLSR